MSVKIEPTRYYETVSNGTDYYVYDNGSYTVDSASEVMLKKRELTLDEILFDDEETYRQKMKEVVVHMAVPANVTTGDLVSYPGNIIYVDSPNTIEKLK